jgi:polysaccharide deacetylase family protein (PEP-CTERM system associated)
MAVRNGISVDVEDWFSLVRRRFAGVEEPPTERVVSATRRLLDLLDEAGTRATFFVLGNVAETYPHLVREVAGRGHEIGTHGHDHWRLDTIGPDRFREELRRSRTAIEQACGHTPIGHRAPEFSVTRETPWAFEVMQGEGLHYDSSVYPIRHRRYGIPGAPLGPYTVGALRELPLATLVVRGRRMPAAGGGYLRYFPYRLVASAVQQANDRGQPAVVYVHPYEFDTEPLHPDPPPPGAHGRVYVAMQNAFRGLAPGRVARLLQSFEFGPLADIA